MVHSLYDLNAYIQRVVALNFQQPLWIATEIAHVGQSRGHYYLDLVQKGEGDELIAQAQAVLWAADYKRLYKNFGQNLESVLSDGLAVKLCVRVDFHPRYGLKLQITDLDPAFTFGQLSLQRRQTIETLQREGLLSLNGALPLPHVLQRIAVISSEGAAGFQDFREHLAENPFGYYFDCQLFNAAVQGRNTEREVIDAVEQITARQSDFDCVVIIRGGGARLDLASFDSLDLCRSVSRLPLPVFSGIGHEVDETVLDLVAHTNLKTPTAVADFLLQHNLAFESAVTNLGAQIRSMANQQLKANLIAIETLQTALQWNLRARLRNAADALVLVKQQVGAAAKQMIQNHDRRLERAELICQALHPENTLRRGYSLTTKNGKIVVSPFDVVAGDILETRLRDGIIKSKV